jgi:circadian clock protein KaiA
LLHSEPLAESLVQLLGGDRYTFVHFRDQSNFLQHIEQEKNQVDCLVLETNPELPQLFHRLHQQTILLPAVILDSLSGEPLKPASSAGASGSAQSDSRFAYHIATLRIPAAELNEITQRITEAISRFLTLASGGDVVSHESIPNSATLLSVPRSLSVQQQRLAEKLKERLGYLGVYYKRNPADFFRNMTQPQKQELLQQLKADYRKIILTYFSTDPKVNQQIDNFVNLAFFADISVTQIMEIHMELMDEFSKQLKLEGRSDEILLDYRLTLIDAIAHLCEMYRRSIPRES